MDHFRATSGGIVFAVVALLSFAGGCAGSWKGSWIYVLPVVLWQVVALASLHIANRAQGLISSEK
jgi:hypothetical protein